MSSINARIARLWEQLPKPVIVLCRLPDGSERELSVDECIHQGGDFIRVVSGSDLLDIRKILDTMPSVIT